MLLFLIERAKSCTESLFLVIFQIPMYECVCLFETRREIYNQNFVPWIINILTKTLIFDNKDVNKKWSLSLNSWYHFISHWDKQFSTTIRIYCHNNKNKTIGVKKECRLIGDNSVIPIFQFVGKKIFIIHIRKKNMIIYSFLSWRHE